MSNIIVVGLARHGKDTVSAMIADKLGLTFQSSSMVLLDEVIYPVLKDKYGYKDEHECFEDRVNHRQEWFELLRDYNTPDATRLGRLIFSRHKIYCGLRNTNELEALVLAGLVDYIVWVDAVDRLGVTESESITIWPDEANYIINNNGDLADLEAEVNDFCAMIKGHTL